MSEGARFQIVLVDETPPDSQTAKPDTGPSPPPFVPPPPAVSATTPTPQPKPTDRPAPLTDSATPVKERADRRPNDNEKSESQKDFDRVKKAAISLDDIIGTGGLVRKAVAMVDVARTVIEGLNAVKRHQLVYKALGTHMGQAIHALSIQTYTGEEWQHQQPFKTL